MNLSTLREKHPVFTYRSSAWKINGDDLSLEWEMVTKELKFSPKVTIFKAAGGASKLAKGELDNLVFHLGLADIFSYWKTTCSPEIKISAGFLTADQIAWWHDLLISGMGQYFYTNQIDFRPVDFVRLYVTSRGRVYQPTSDQIWENQRVLIPVGGGQDSAVTLELLSKYHGPENVGAFAMTISKATEVPPASERLVKTAGVPRLIKVHRELDPEIFVLSEKGYLNGHVPFTAYLSFLSVLIARLFGFSEVAFSNERSSNEANLEYLRAKINHQYSKSFEFEQKFREYNLRYLSDLSYLSFLRPLYELQITRLFSHMPQYFAQIRSCNVGYKSDSWCGQCPKCLSIFVGLFPFVKTEQLRQIFGANLFENENLIDLTMNVLGLGAGKPFECIGTFEETVVAFYLSLKKGQADPGQSAMRKTPVLLEHFKKNMTILENKLGDLQKLSEKILASWDKNNHLPTGYQKVLKNAYAKTNNQ